MPANSFVIETASHAAGVAVADDGQFLFFAAGPLFMPLDGKRFASVAEIERACREREAASGRPSSRQRDAA
ncbi:MAG TPA: hypothetical protein VED40_01575 [Azospirillaceae bacterium]|nr:hypothetical protein [Azospirillaceae bacterium]